MNGDSRDEWATGRLVRLSKVLPPVQVDASEWDADIPTEQWTTGRLAPPLKSLSRQEIDASTWDTGPAWLELLVTFAPGSTPLQAVEWANRAIGLLQSRALLSYDASRSRAEGEAFVIALVPHEKMSEERLVSLASSLPAGLPPVRVARAA